MSMRFKVAGIILNHTKNLLADSLVKGCEGPVDVTRNHSTQRSKASFSFFSM